MIELYICRHGNTFDKDDVIRRVGRGTDLELSDSGRNQAAALGDYFRNAEICFDKVYAAPLKRTVQTAEAIRDATKPSTPFETSDALTEIDYGPDEGMPEAQVVQRIGETALAAWETDATPPAGWIVDPTALIAAWRGVFKTVATGGDHCVMAVTSNGVARFALDAADARPAQCPRKLRTGAFGRAIIEPGGRVFIDFWDRRP